MSLSLDAVSAYDAAFSGRSAQVVDHVGGVEPFDVPTWAAEPDWIDHQLFIAPCDAETIDVGCGPGRLVGALTCRNVPAMGIDVSPEAVRQTRVRGAHAVRGDVFAAIPGEGSWAYALLADGNLGIGGDPVRLLARLADVLAPGGRVIAEVADHGAGLVRERRQLRIDGQLSAPFDWAVVGLDAIAGVAAEAGMHVLGTSSVGGRHTVTMHRRRP
jgi:SAM-dependent methyltransferase